MQKGVIITLLLFVCFSVPANASFPKGIFNSTVEIYADSNLQLAKADSLYHTQNYLEAAKAYEKIAKNPELYQIPVLKKLAFCYAALNSPNRSIAYIDQYLLTEFDTTILMDDAFDPIKDSKEFKAVVKKYTPNFSIISFIYFWVALIGFFITITLSLNKRIENISKILIGAFIFIHSFFILHICLNITNYQYQFPHSYLMSTSFSFLYGPLLYFYFKRVTLQYTFRKKDVLHLIPTLLFLIYIVPIYALTKDEKLAVMLGNASKNYNPADSVYVGLIVSLKLASLVIYGYFIRKLYLSSRKNVDYPKEHRAWLKNVFGIHFFYILSYAIYGALISNHISSGFFYHFQIACMSSMVIYVGYIANVQPNVFNWNFVANNKLSLKYEKSGLTQSLSNELKTQLIQLFNEEKIYKESNINLEILAKSLNTTRHNASQVINEHFNMSFHELINTYRIHEAKQILNNDNNRNFNIIDIAYEVGYNNKVTFNKAFKKETNLTPSEYQRKQSFRISS
ncbi:helix-turn-helix domain-containing protein [Spongiimicrobium salis]|uniref:helix-turn-helix domain-containing protein n=1 Tax=Spongiimicrobium salis TaxID=1667022 RepID=UPI00374D26A1